MVARAHVPARPVEASTKLHSIGQLKRRITGECSSRPPRLCACLQFPSNRFHRFAEPDLSRCPDKHIHHRPACSSLLKRPSWLATSMATGTTPTEVGWHIDRRLQWTRHCHTRHLRPSSPSPQVGSSPSPGDIAQASLSHLPCSEF
jgi:hypothetical protein